MKLSPAQLQKQLGSQLQPCYWVSGDETLLALESVDAIRQAAIEAGFSQRTICHVDAHTDWNAVFADAGGMSLFGDKNLIEIRFPNAKPKADILKLLHSVLEPANPDTLLLISGPKLDSATLKSKGYKALEPLIASVTIWPVGTEELPTWLQDRLQQNGLTIDGDGLALLAANVEGNLLAAQQQIMQLALLSEDKHITADWLGDVIANDARFDVFGTVDKALGDDQKGALRALESLAAEGVQPANISWLFAREVQNLITIRELAKSIGPDQALQKSGVWKRREPIIRSALRRLKLPQLYQCLQKAQSIDAIAKGQAAGNAWDEISSLVLMLGGHHNSVTIATPH